jgi:hypothetical protein
MKKVICISALCLFLATTAFAQEGVKSGIPLKHGFVADLNFSVPLFAAVQSNDPNTNLDLVTNAGIGGGLTIYWADPTIADYKMVIAINAPEFILTPRFGSETNVDFILGADLGLFDNRLRMGMGYDFGSLPYERSRWIGLLSIGVK